MLLTTSLRTLLCLGVVVLIAIGCAPAEPPTPLPPTAIPSTPLPPTAIPPTPTPVEEKYEKVDSSELPIDLQASMRGAVRWDADGNITEFDGGKVTRFAVGGKSIELVSDELLLEGKEVFIATKDHGKIKVTFNPNFTVSVWLKPSQKAKLKELGKLTSTATAILVPPTATTRATSIASPQASAFGRIAFQSDRNGNSDIYVVNADRSGLANLTNNPAFDGLPAWSPDGKQIAFQSNRDGNNEIYVMNADGSGVTRLTNNLASDGDPSWSPDRKRIAFYSKRDGDFEVYVMNVDGSGQTNLTKNPACDFNPAWSPDGKQIAFYSDRVEACQNVPNQEIYVMNVDGSGVTRLTDSCFSDVGPAWSPDGTKIAFADPLGGISVMNADGSSRIQLININEDNGSPAWSPDGKQIAFDSSQDGKGEIYIVNLNDSSLIRLTNDPADDSFPAWQPRKQ